MDRIEILESKVAVITTYLSSVIKGASASISEGEFLAAIEECGFVQMPAHFCTRRKPHDGPCNGTLTHSCHARAPRANADAVPLDDVVYEWES